jgi:hypothetical protein
VLPPWIANSEQAGNPRSPPGAATERGAHVAPKPKLPSRRTLAQRGPNVRKICRHLQSDRSLPRFGR